MFRVILFMLISAVMMAHQQSVAKQSVYVDKTQQPIKALSAEAIRQLRNGEGMGLALSAELNQYPGPKHVIELYEELTLSADQLQLTQELFQQMQQAAKKLGVQLIRHERQLEMLFRTGKITAQQIHEQVSLITGVQAELRSLHLITHIKQREILSVEQQHRYQQLRGYLQDSVQGDHQHESHHPAHSHSH